MPVVTAGDVSLDDVATAGCGLVAELVEASFKVADSPETEADNPHSMVEIFEPILGDDALADAASSLKVDQADLIEMREAAFSEIREQGTFDSMSELMETLNHDC